MQQNAYRKWQKSVTKDEFKLNLDTTLKNLCHEKTGGPLSGRDPNLVDKLKKEYKPEMNDQKEYS